MKKVWVTYYAGIIHVPSCDSFVLADNRNSSRNNPSKPKPTLCEPKLCSDSELDFGFNITHRTREIRVIFELPNLDYSKFWLVGWTLNKYYLWIGSMYIDGGDAYKCNNDPSFSFALSSSTYAESVKVFPNRNVHTHVTKLVGNVWAGWLRSMYHCQHCPMESLKIHVILVFWPDRPSVLVNDYFA